MSVSLSVSSGFDILSLCRWQCGNLRLVEGLLVDKSEVGNDKSTAGSCRCRIGAVVRAEVGILD
jgi:hypothetical protein